MSKRSCPESTDGEETSSWEHQIQVRLTGGPKCCHMSYSPSHTFIPIVWQTWLNNLRTVSHQAGYFLMSLPIPHSGQPAQPEQSRQLWWNLLLTLWLLWMANQKTRTLVSTLPLTHWDIWGLGKAAYLCRPVSSSDKWSDWAVNWLTCNLMSRLSEWDDDLGEEGWKSAEKERIPVGEWPWVGL